MVRGRPGGAPARRGAGLDLKIVAAALKETIDASQDLLGKAHFLAAAVEAILAHVPPLAQAMSKDWNWRDERSGPK